MVRFLLNEGAAMAFTVHDGSPTDATTAPQPQPGAEAEATQHVAWLAAKAQASKEDRHKYLLLLRFALVNIVGAALLGAAWITGYVGQVYAGDKTMISLAIFIVFIGGLGLCGYRVFQTSHELNAVRDFNPLVPSLAAMHLARLRGQNNEGRSLAAGSLRLKLSHRIAVVKHVAGALVLLGLIGTVVGFIIALSGVDPEKASDFDSISPMVSTLIQGMSTALYTTLVGAVLNLWLMINYRMLATGTVKLITSIIDFGEQHGRT